MQRPIIAIAASPRARDGADSVLLRLMRDYELIFKNYCVYATENTGDIILNTGLYTEGTDLFKTRPGDLGGIVELAALVASRKCNVVFLLLDPNDTSANTVENWALRR